MKKEGGRERAVAAVVLSGLDAERKQQQNEIVQREAKEARMWQRQQEGERKRERVVFVCFCACA